MGRRRLALGVLSIALLAGPFQAQAKELPKDIQNLLDQEKYGAAIEPLKAYTEDKKKDAEGWTALGTAHFFLEDYPSALEALNQALKLDKKNWLANHFWVRTQTELGAYADADDKVRWAIKNTKGKDEIQAMFYHDLGLEQLAQNMLDSADLNFYKAIGQAPDSCQYRLDLGEINFAQKIYPLAISVYEDVLDCNANLAGPVYHRIAKAFLYQREFKNAVAAYQKSAEAKPSADVYSDLGDALILWSRSVSIEDTAQIFGLYRQAISAYQKAKENSPGGCRIFEKLGKAEALMGRLDAAVDDFQAALDCGSKDPNVFFALANVLIDLGRYDEALAKYDDYEAVRAEELEEHPWGAPDADFFANRGLAFRSKADSTAAGPVQDSLYDRAIEAYRKALELDSTRANIVGDLGIVLFNMNRFDEAIPVFEEKIAMEPELTNGYLNLAYCYLQLKRYSDVLDALDRMLGVDSCNAKAFEIGGYVAAFEMKSGRLARQWYNRQLECYPTHCDARMYIGYTYLVTNDTTQIRQAIPVLREAYDCRLEKGEKSCSENGKQNALWLAEAYLAIRDLDQASRWAQKVLNCEPGHKRAGEIKKQAESEY